MLGIDNNDISIIIPVYNVEKYIDKFMVSLSKQTIQNFIAIFIDDNSSDDSIRIVNQYLPFFNDRIVIIMNNSNLGPGVSRNVGLDYLETHRTKYVTFLDPDDWMDDEYLEDLYSNAENDNLDICISGLVRYNEELSKDVCTEMVKMKSDKVTNVEDCDELAYINTCLYSKLFRYEPISTVRFKKMRRSEDTCYLFEALNRYNTLKFTNHAYYHYCVRKDSLTGNMNYEKYHTMHKEFALLLSEFAECHSKILEQFVSQIFIRSSIGGVYRLSLDDIKSAIRLEKKEYDYLEKKVNNWRRCKYLTLRGVIIGGLKGTALVSCAYLYKLHVFSLFVMFYSFVSKKLGIEVRM